MAGPTTDRGALSVGQQILAASESPGAANPVVHIIVAALDGGSLFCVERLGVAREQRAHDIHAAPEVSFFEGPLHVLALARSQPGAVTRRQSAATELEVAIVSRRPDVELLHFVQPRLVAGSLGAEAGRVVQARESRLDSNPLVVGEGGKPAPAASQAVVQVFDTAALQDILVAASR